jgi:hypothetical protein
MGLCVLGVVLLAGSAVALRFGAANAASITDTTCTSASYLADVAPLTGTDTTVTVTFNCSSPATIDVTSGGPGMVVVSGAKTLSLSSIGHSVTLSGAGKLGLFQVASIADTLQLAHLTLSGGSAANGGAIYNNGTLTVTDSTLSGNAAAGGAGGAIYQNTSGVATITNSVLTDNLTDGGNGGAIASVSAMLTIAGSNFSGNAATGSSGDEGRGGAVYSSGTLTISNSTFTDNSATGGAGSTGEAGGVGSGGAVDVSFGTVTISNTTFSGNSATGGAGGPGSTGSSGSDGGAAGGGAVNILPGTTVTVSDATFVGNSSTGGTGGPAGAAPVGMTASILTGGTGGTSFGGALNYSSGGGVGAVPGGLGGSNSGGGVGAITVAASTFTGNTTTGGSGSSTGPGYGGAVYTASGGGVGAIPGLSPSVAASGAIADTLVVGNTASASGSNCVSTLSDDGYNLTDTGDAGCGFSPASHDVLTSDARLGPFGNNGGQAPTLALLADSPAIDAIPPNGATTPTGCGVAGGPLATDARGVSRPQGAGCDIGAYELAPRTATHLTANPSDTTQGQSVQLCATVTGTVSGTGTPTGTVTFLDGSSTLGTGTLVAGAVCISTSTLSLGTHSITAKYGGDPQFDPSVSSPASVTVGVNGLDVAGAPAGSSGGQASAGGAPGNTNAPSGQQAQSVSTIGPSALAASSSSTSSTQPGVSSNWPAGLGMWLGVLLLLVGLGGLSMVMVRAARR